MRPGFIPFGEKFHATIQMRGLEEVLEENGAKASFDSAAAAVIYARRMIRLREAEARPVPQVDPEVAEAEEIHRKWKLARAEEQRQLREQFDMRKVEVITKKRKFQPGRTMRSDAR